MQKVDNIQRSILLVRTNLFYVYNVVSKLGLLV